MARPPKNKVLLETASIDREATEPAYAQLTNILRQSMAEGLLRPGDQLPSEAQLVELLFHSSPLAVWGKYNWVLLLLIDKPISNDNCSWGLKS